MTRSGLVCAAVVIAVAGAVFAAVGAPEPCVTNPLAGACVGQDRPEGGDARWTIWVTAGTGVVAVVLAERIASQPRRTLIVAFGALTAVCMTGALIAAGRSG